VDVDPSREPATVDIDPSREPATVDIDPSREPATVDKKYLSASTARECSRARSRPRSQAPGWAVHLVAVNTVGRAPPAVSGHADPSVLTRILDHLKLPSTPPPLAPARSPLDEQDLFAEEEPSDPAYQEEFDPCDEGSSARAPP